MTTERIDVIALHCDQGMGNLIQFWDSTDLKTAKLTNLVIIDLGTDSHNAGLPRRAVDTVKDALSTMVKQKTPPRIEKILLSHQDLDHWSLLKPLRDVIDKDFPATTVGEIRYGGADWGTKPTGELKSWKDRFGVESKPLPLAYTDYKDDGTMKQEIPALAGVVFRVLYVNMQVPGYQLRSKKNATSAVIVVEFGGSHGVFPGDATVDTAGKIVDIYEKWKKLKDSPNPTAPCKVVQVPHHGALRTMSRSFTTKNPKPEDLTLGQTWANFMSAENVVASAGYKTNHHHPWEIVMNVFGVAARKRTNVKEHDYVVYQDSVFEWRVRKDQKTGLFTTLLSLDNPPAIQDWNFSIDKTGKVTFWLEGNEPTGRSEAPRVERHPARPRLEVDAESDPGLRVQ